MSWAIWSMVSPLSFFPRTPLLSINRTEVAVFVGPFVPDPDFVFLEIADVGLSFEKPEELVNDRAKV